ncbi:MAG: zf-HC2 domain-containing protein [bacterium]|nr:zf-HC2 domain-containing protein [bacterium]
MIGCDKILQMLPDYDSGAIDSESAQEVEEHLGRCSSCQAEYDKILSEGWDDELFPVDSALKEKEISPSPSYKLKFWFALGASRETAARKSAFSKKWLTAAAAAAIVFSFWGGSIYAGGNMAESRADVAYAQCDYEPLADSEAILDDQVFDDCLEELNDM